MVESEPQTNTETIEQKKRRENFGYLTHFMEQSPAVLFYTHIIAHKIVKIPLSPEILKAIEEHPDVKLYREILKEFSDVVDPYRKEELDYKSDEDNA